MLFLEMLEYSQLKSLTQLYVQFEAKSNEINRYLKNMLQN